MRAACFGFLACTGRGGLRHYADKCTTRLLSKPGFEEQQAALEKSRTPSPVVKAAAAVRRPGRLGEASALRNGSRNALLEDEEEAAKVMEEEEEPAAEEEEQEEQPAPARSRQPASSSAAAAATASKAALAKRPAARADDDDDISEMSLSPEASLTAPIASKQPAGGKPASAGGRPSAETGSGGGIGRAGPGLISGGALRERPAPKEEKYEGELKPLLRDAKAIIAGKLSAAMAAAKRRSSGARRGSGEEEDAESEGMGAEDEGVGATGSGGGGKVGGAAPSESRVRLSEALAVAQERQKERERERHGGSQHPGKPLPSSPAAAAVVAGVSEDEARNALFTVGGTSSGSKGARGAQGGTGSKGGSSRGSEAAAAKTEDELRAELFGGSSAASPKPSKQAGKLQIGAATPAASVQKGSLLDRTGAAAGGRKPAVEAAAYDEYRGSDAGSDLEAPEPVVKAAAVGSVRKAGPAAAVAAAAAGGATAGAEQLRAENEKLRAQLTVLRDQVAAVDGAKKQAKLREDRLASERDDYKQQVEELQDQLKEVSVCGSGQLEIGWVHVLALLLLTT